MDFTLHMLIDTQVQLFEGLYVAFYSFNHFYFIFFLISF